MHNSRQTCQVLKEEAMLIPSWATSARTRHFICISKTEEGFSSQSAGRARRPGGHQEQLRKGRNQGAGGPGTASRPASRAGTGDGRRRKTREGRGLSATPHHATCTCMCTHTYTQEHKRALTPSPTRAHTCTHAPVLSHTFTCTYTREHTQSHMPSHTDPLTCAHFLTCTLPDMRAHSHIHIRLITLVH